MNDAARVPADHEQINTTIRYAMWSVFATPAPPPADAHERPLLVAAALPPVRGGHAPSAPHLDPVPLARHDVAGLCPGAPLLAC